MLDLFFLLKSVTGLLFLAIASYQDLKTTEISDKVVYLFLLLSILLNIIESITSSSLSPIENSFINGAILSLVGFIMYITGQWGAGDSFLLSAVGFLNPFSESLIFSLEYFFVLVIAGTIYVLLYSSFIFLKNKRAKQLVSKEFNKHLKGVFFVLSSTILFFFIYLINNSIIYLTISTTIFASLILYITLIYLKGVEESMVKRISVKNLKVGDVLKESKKWVGIDEKTLSIIRKTRKYVYIKEGVRFAPAFLIAFILILTMPNSLEHLISFLQ